MNYKLRVALSYQLMNMKKQLIFLVVILCLVQAVIAQPAVNRFSISGTMKGFEENTFLYLSDLSEGSYKIIDSVKINSGKIRLGGVLPYEVAKFAIHTKDLKDRVTFWIDRSETTIRAEKGKFKMAVVKGSKEQERKNELDSIVSNTKNEQKDYTSFIRRNPSSIVSASLLGVYASTWNKDTVRLLYQLLSPEAKNTIYGKSIHEYLSVNKTPSIGEPYVDFSQENMEGKAVKLSDYKGKVVLLEFWGSWCMPCRKGHPELIATYNEFKGKGFEILGVAADVDKQQLMDAIKEDRLPWENVSDWKGDRNIVALIYGVSYYPANFLIDKDGKVVAKDLRGEKLRERLRGMMGRE